MKLTDTHSHLVRYGVQRRPRRGTGPRRGGGVEHLLLPGIDSESHGALFDLCRRHPGQCVPMMGLHPTSVNDNPHWREELALAERYLTAPPEGIARFCAVGEIGLDYYWSGEFVAEQGRGFRFAMPPGRTARASGGDPHPVRHGTTCAGSSGKRRRPRRRRGYGCGACSTPFRRIPAPTGN